MTGADSTRRRVLINSDAKNEADDQFAIVHALLSPTLHVRGLIAAHFGTRRSDRSMLDSRDEIELLLRLVDMEGQVPVPNGSAVAIPDESTPADSAGARMIIEESKLASETDPLYIAFLGPLTDMASAILLEPEIIHRPLVVIWIGGVAHDGREAEANIEFNLANDIAAANVVFDSGITLWQVPSDVYRMVSVSYAELDEEIGAAGRLGEYLIRQLREWNATWHPGPIESRSLGDSPAIALMLYPKCGRYRMRPAPRFGAEGHHVPGSGHVVKVFEAIDVRFLLADMFAKIRRFATQRSANDRAT